MQSTPHPSQEMLALGERIVARVQTLDGAVLDDLKFLAAWDAGQLPLLGNIVRVRQLRRANPPGGSPGRHPAALPAPASAEGPA